MAMANEDKKEFNSMLKTSGIPMVQQLEKSFDEAQKWAASVGYEESDVNDIIKSVRKRRGK